MVKNELCIYDMLLTLISPSGSSKLLCPRSLLFFFSFSFLHPAWKHTAHLAGIANCSFHPSDLVAFGMMQEGLLVAVGGVRGVASLSLQHPCVHCHSVLSHTGHSFAGSVTPQEEEELRCLAAMPNIYETIAKSIAPSIYGSADIKKAIACLLFGGSRKRWGEKSHSGHRALAQSSGSATSISRLVAVCWY